MGRIIAAMMAMLCCVCVRSCTNVLVTQGASADGTVLIGDNDDASRRHGLVTHFEAADHDSGTTRQIFDFETSKLLGEIPQPSHTYSTISHGNEHGVVIAETTHGGLEVLSQPRTGKIMDYGSLIVTTLQRATTAREAIKTLVDLSNTYGYASSMEGFSITDGTEGWYMELIGKGKWGIGLLWVALRVPDGYVTANANQGRITTFLPCNDPDVCMAAPDVVKFAVDHGLYHGKVDDPSFSFSDVYDPITVTGARFCEARVWYVFSQIADETEFNSTYYLPYAQGFNLSRRMPLWVRPKQKLSRNTVHTLLSSSYEKSWLDPSLDVGAGAEHSPKRWNGLTWELSGKKYVNERVIGTQSTAWHFVASVKGKSEPAPMRALLWWGTDEHGVAPKVPLFGGATAVHRTYDDGNCSARLACRRSFKLPGSMMEFSWESAYWVNSAVAKLVAADTDRAQPVVDTAKNAYDDWVATKLANAQKQAREQFSSGDHKGGIATLNELAIATTKEATERWIQLWQTLMVSFVDGLTATKDDDNLICGCKKDHPTFSDAWLGKIVTDTGDHYRLPDSSCEYVDADGHCHKKRFASQDLHNRPIPKLEVPGVIG